MYRVLHGLWKVHLSCTVYWIAHILRNKLKAINVIHATLHNKHCITSDHEYKCVRAILWDTTHTTHNDLRKVCVILDAGNRNSPIHDISVSYSTPQKKNACYTYSTRVYLLLCDFNTIVVYTARKGVTYLRVLEARIDVPLLRYMPGGLSNK